MNLKIGFKKKLYQFRYLEQEFLECQALESKGRTTFMADLREIHAKLNVYDDILDKPYEKVDSQTTQKSDP